MASPSATTASPGGPQGPQGLQGPPGPIRFAEDGEEGPQGPPGPTLPPGPSISYAGGQVTVDLTYAFPWTNTHTWRKDQNAASSLQISNQNAGGNAASASYIALNDSSGQIEVGVFGSAKTAVGAITANSAFVRANGGTLARLALMADAATGIIVFATGGTTEVARIDATGQFGLGTTPTQLMHIRKDQNTNTMFLLENQNAGNASQTNIRNVNDVASIIQVGLYGSGNAGYGAILANTAYIYSGGLGTSSRLVIMVDRASTGILVFATGGNAEVARFNADGTLTLGVASTKTGALNLTHVSNAFTTTLKAAAATSASKTYSLPVTDGSAGQKLTTDGSGNLSWT